ACWRRSAPLARCRSGDAMTTAERWRFASPSTASKRSTSRMKRRLLPRTETLVLPPPPKSKHRHPKPLPPASGVPLQHRSRLARSITRARRRPKLACGAIADRARSRLACSRCWADRRERRLLPSCARPIGSSTPSAASSPVWCAKGLASICARRKSTVTGPIASSTAAVRAPIPAVRIVAQLERHAARGDRSGGAIEIGRLAAERNHRQTELRPGTLLTREWDGHLQQVMVLADGFAWNGKTYRSLSKAAFAITGSRWSGPRFFGLDQSPSERR